MRELNVDWFDYRIDQIVGQVSFFLTPPKRILMTEESSRICWCEWRLKHICRGQEKAFWVSYYWTSLTWKHFFKFGEYRKLAPTKTNSFRKAINKNYFISKYKTKTILSSSNDASYFRNYYKHWILRNPTWRTYQGMFINIVINNVPKVCSFTQQANGVVCIVNKSFHLSRIPQSRKS